MQSNRVTTHENHNAAAYATAENEEQLEAMMERDAALLVRNKKLDKIEGFNGYFQFLKIDFPCKVYFDGEYYNSAAHAFAAAKTDDETDRRRIRKAPTHQEMVKIAQYVKEPADWEEKKLAVMECLTREKFRRDRELREKLKATNTRSLVNILHGGDARMNSNQETIAEKMFWGQIGTKGNNKLGEILEKVRLSIADDCEIEEWIKSTVDLVDGDRKAMPKIEIDVLKDSELIESITLSNNPMFIFGRGPKCDMVLRHESIDLQQAAFVLDKEKGAMVISLGSGNGSILNDTPMEPNVPYPLRNKGDKVEFAQSTRSYVIRVDYSAMQREAEEALKQMEMEMIQLEKLNDKEELDVETFKSSFGLVK